MSRRRRQKIGDAQRNWPLGFCRVGQFLFSGPAPAARSPLAALRPDCVSPPTVPVRPDGACPSRGWLREGRRAEAAPWTRRHCLPAATVERCERPLRRRPQPLRRRPQQRHGDPCAGGQLKLPENGSRMAARGVDADAESRGHLLVAEAFRPEERDLRLSLGQGGAGLYLVGLREHRVARPIVLPPNGRNGARRLDEHQDARCPFVRAPSAGTQTKASQRPRGCVGRARRRSGRRALPSPSRAPKTRLSRSSGGLVDNVRNQLLNRRPKPIRRNRHPRIGTPASARRPPEYSALNTIDGVVNTIKGAVRRKRRDPVRSGTVHIGRPIAPSTAARPVTARR